MSQHPLGRRIFDVHDSVVEVDDAPLAPAPAATIQSRDEHIPTSTAPIDEAERQVEKAQKSGLLSRWRFSLAGLAFTGFAGLASLAFGLWTTSLIEGLFARAESLGWIGLAFGVLFLLGLLGLIAREALAVGRQTKIAEMHVAFAKARAADDREAARRLVGQLVALYRDRPETAHARAQVEDAARAIVDGRDLVDVAERALLRPLDEKAQAEIATAAKRVSLVTAISPRAVVDVIFVVAQITRLVRQIAEIYGGRPGLLGLIKLARSISAHIAITGGLAVGDSLIQQIFGHGIAARINARLGEGVLNGLLTARVGLSALAVCRPAPFAVVKAPGVRDVAPFLFSSGKGD